MSLHLVVASLVAATVLSGIGAVFLLFTEERLEKIVQYLISLSAGSILGGVFIHLVFRIAEGSGYTRLTGLLVLAGVAGSLVLERAVHWHCHNRGSHVEPLSYILIAGDSIHNVLDGVLIASSFFVGVSSGIAATVAVMMHKIPKEAGDFGVLVHSGFSRLQAVGFNLGISLFMFLGAGIVILLSRFTGGVVTYLLPLVVGNFVYIAGSDLVPEFKDSEEDFLKHMVAFSAGVGLMYLIPFVRSLVV